MRGVFMPVSVEGVRSSNTDPANFNSALLVGSGIDTYSLNVKCDPVRNRELVDALVAMRAAEKSRAELDGSDPLPVPSTLLFAGEELLILPHGRKSWSVVLHNELLDIELGRGGVSKVFALIRCSSVYLWSRPLSSVHADVQAFVSEYLPDGELQPSELHLARDVAGFDVASRWSDLRPGIIGRASHLRTLENRGTLETVMIGSRGSPISAEVYNKLAELRKSHKEWFRELWARNGWDGESPVWRVEFRMRRDFLREASINTLGDVEDKLAGLWSYATAHWLRHSDESDQGNVTRREVSLWWAPYAAPWDESDCTPVTRAAVRAANATALVNQAAGCLLGAGALIGMTVEGEIASLVLDRFAELLTVLPGEDFGGLLDKKRRRYGIGAADDTPLMMAG